MKSMAASDLGFTGAANLAAWPAAIRNVRARYTDTVIVPGHGPVDLSGQAYSTRSICSPPRIVAQPRRSSGGTPCARSP